MKIFCFKKKIDNNTQSQQTKKTANCSLLFALCSLLTIYSLACTFDYGEADPDESKMPDLVMINVEYVRVRSSDPIVRFQAKRAERYEEQSIMKLENFSFEQFGSSMQEVNAIGTAGNAEIEINTGNILMDNGVRVEVESEDIIIETKLLEWIDESKILATREDDEVYIFMNDGTNFVGLGFKADAKWRTWEFTGSVQGEYIFEDDEEEKNVAEPVSVESTDADEDKTEDEGKDDNEA